MGDKRIDGAAEEATRGEADPGDGQGLATAGAHGGGLTGGTTDDVGDLTTQNDERAEKARGGDTEDADISGATEGERFVRRAEERRQA